MKSLISAIQERIQGQFDFEDLLFYGSIPVENHVSKKNGRPIFKNKYTGQAMLGKSERLKNAERSMELYLKSEANKQLLLKPIDCKIWAIFLFYFTKDIYFTKKGEMSKFVPDLSNLYELPQDALTKSLIIDDDRLIESHDLSRRLVGHETKLEIFLLKYKGP